MTCKHEETGTTPRGSTYCLQCGLRMFGEPGPIRLRDEQSSPDWQKITEHGYVVHLGVTYIGARFDEETRTWNLNRVVWCDDCRQFEVKQEGLNIHQRDHKAARATHIHPDPIGVPPDGLSAHRLPSVAA